MVIRHFFLDAVGTNFPSQVVSASFPVLHPPVFVPFSLAHVTQGGSASGGPSPQSRGKDTELLVTSCSLYPRMGAGYLIIFTNKMLLENTESGRLLCSTPVHKKGLAVDLAPLFFSF